MCTFLNETNRARKSQTFHNRRRTKQQQHNSEKNRFKNSYPLRFRIWCASRDREKTEYKLDYHSVIRLSMETGRGGRERWDFPSIQYQYFGTPDGAGCGVCRVPRELKRNKKHKLFSTTACCRIPIASIKISANEHICSESRLHRRPQNTSNENEKKKIGKNQTILILFNENNLNVVGTTVQCTSYLFVCGEWQMCCNGMS